MTADPVLERTFAVDAGGRCRLRVPRTYVHIDALEAANEDGSDEARVTLTAPEATDPDAEAAAHALADRLNVRYADGVVRVEPDAPPRPDARDWRTLRGEPPLLRLCVRLPPGFGADVHVSSGSLDARGLGGPVTLEAAGSAVHAVGLGGPLDVQARRSPTTVEGFAGQTCTAHISGGPFTIKGATADAVEIESRAARLRLDDIEAALHLNAHQGAVAIAGLRGPLDANVHGGRCTIAPETGHAVRLRAPGSDAHLHLPGANDESSNSALIEAHAPGGTLRCK